MKRAMLICGLIAAAPITVAQSAPQSAAPQHTAAPVAPPAAANAPLQDAPGTVLLLRGLDKITGRPTDIKAPLGQAVHFATLTITARYCYSTPASETPETAAFVQIEDHRPDQPARRVFSGWMYASSPGLNAMEHPIYDIWAISCSNNGAATAPLAAMASTKPSKVLSPDSSDKEGLVALPEDSGQ